MPRKIPGTTIRIYYRDPKWESFYEHIESSLGVKSYKMLDEFYFQVVTEKALVIKGLWIRDCSWPFDLAKVSDAERGMEQARTLHFKAGYDVKFQHRRWHNPEGRGITVPRGHRRAAERQKRKRALERAEEQRRHLDRTTPGSVPVGSD